MSEPPPTVLVADDASARRLILQSLLVNQGYRLLFARTGAEAVALAAAEQPDVVLCDARTTAAGGYDLIAAVRANPATADVPILVAVSPDDREAKLKGLEAGADDFLDREFDKVELLTRVRAAVRMNGFRRKHRERAKFEWVVEHADDGYLTLDAGGRVRYANARARRDLGEPSAAPFWKAVAAGYAVVGQPDSDGPVYLIRPETANGPGVWFRADRFALPENGQSMLRLRDVTDERRLRQSLWAYRATQKYGMKVKVPKGGSPAQAAEPGRGVRADEWVRVLQTWVSLAAPTGSQVLIAGALPTAGLVLPMEGFALLAAELLQFVRHPADEDAGPATLTAGTEGECVALTLRCPVRFPDAVELRHRWTPRYRGRGGAESGGEPDPFTGEAASLVWNVGGRVDTRADATAGWVEVKLTLPTQPAVEVAATKPAAIIDDDHSLIGG